MEHQSKTFVYLLPLWIKLCLIFFWFINKSFIVKLPTILFQRYVTDKMEPDKVEKVQGQVDELKGIMVKNIGK